MNNVHAYEFLAKQFNAVYDRKKTIDQVIHETMEYFVEGLPKHCDCQFCKDGDHHGCGACKKGTLDKPLDVVKVLVEGPEPNQYDVSGMEPGETRDIIIDGQKLGTITKSGEATFDVVHEKQPERDYYTKAAIDRRFARLVWALKRHLDDDDLVVEDLRAWQREFLRK